MLPQTSEILVIKIY